MEERHLNDFLKHLKEQLQQCLSVVWSDVGLQQTVVTEVTDE